MKVKKLAVGLALAIILAFASGVFALKVYPAPEENTIKVAQGPSPQVTRCDYWRNLVAQAQTERGAILLATASRTDGCGW